MHDHTAYMVTDVLRDVVKPGSGGTGPTAYVSGFDTLLVKQEHKTLMQEM